MQIGTKTKGFFRYRFDGNALHDLTEEGGSKRQKEAIRKCKVEKGVCSCYTGYYVYMYALKEPPQR